MAKIETVDASLPPTGKRKRKKTFKKRGGEARGASRHRAYPSLVQ